ncbi:hypothetical protein L596_018783 [Steinernema carpocapsae]|uniref:SKP1 component POZ domain-containing protein n=1 Tax=Steinernema carpocapsae TaxID=34508 RepID=A0A4U5N5N4_STECR|nr:hypothetical protein L596_018783 [Steinernema carpocapsae]
MLYSIHPHHTFKISASALKQSVTLRMMLEAVGAVETSIPTSVDSETTRRIVEWSEEHRRDLLRTAPNSTGTF